MSLLQKGPAREDGASSPANENHDVHHRGRARPPPIPRQVFPVEHLHPRPETLVIPESTGPVIVSQAGKGAGG